MNDNEREPTWEERWLAQRYPNKDAKWIDGRTAQVHTVDEAADALRKAALLIMGLASTEPEIDGAIALELGRIAGTASLLEERLIALITKEREEGWE